MNQIKRVWIPADSFYAEEESCSTRDVQVVLASDYERQVAELRVQLRLANIDQANTQAEVADLTAKLAAGRQWTNEQPRTPGWYWWKGRPDVCPDVHYVSEQDIAEGNPPGLWCGPLEAPR